MNHHPARILNAAWRSSLRRLAALAAVTGLAVLSACSGGAPTTANPNTQVASAPAYAGPPAANADVQAFMVNLWANVKASNRCGGCHVQGGQSPQFARTDDVNLAYQAANTVVNLAQASQSTMVQKVAGGHNCWLASPSACGDTLTVWIQNWAGSSATGSQQIKLVAPPVETVGSAKTFPTSPAAFQSTVYPILRQWCSRCHARWPTWSPGDSRVRYRAPSWRWPPPRAPFPQSAITPYVRRMPAGTSWDCSPGRSTGCSSGSSRPRTSCRAS